MPNYWSLRTFQIGFIHWTKMRHVLLRIFSWPALDGLLEWFVVAQFAHHQGSCMSTKRESFLKGFTRPATASAVSKPLKKRAEGPCRLPQTWKQPRHLSHSGSAGSEEPRLRGGKRFHQSPSGPPSPRCSNCSCPVGVTGFWTY